MDPASRTRLVALAVLLAVAAPLVIVALAGSDDDESTGKPAALRVERGAGGLPEITIYVEDRSLNELSTAGGETSVVVECVDAEGRIVWKLPETWPFTDTDAGTVEPHAHIGMEPAQIERIARCRLVGTDPPLEGRLL